MLPAPQLQERRERTFLVLAGIFLCAMTLLNVIGITRFVQLGPMALAVGVLPYPLTFLATDLVCELYGKKRASHMVWVGFGLNMFLLAVCGLGVWLAAAVGLVEPKVDLSPLTVLIVGGGALSFGVLMRAGQGASIWEALKSWLPSSGRCCGAC